MPPSEIGYYQLERLLGEGGMGAVYEAVHRMSGRRVALKTLRAELAERPDLQARFFNEARVTSFLTHPGIVKIFDVGRADDGSAYIVMELCRGLTLGECFRAEPRLNVRMGLLAVVAHALAHAHDKGVIHRDLKPDNVLVVATADGPMPKVVDFGIAKVLDGAAISPAFDVRTRIGNAMGTPLYMSPEQCRGMGGITPASDVYSFGIMMMEAISGRAPFAGGVGEVIVQHLTAAPPRLTEQTLVDGGLDPAIEPLVAAMLEKEPQDRPPMPQVRDALARYAGERRKLVTLSSHPADQAPPASTPPAPPIAVTKPADARRGTPLPLFATALAVVLTLGWVAWRRPAAAPTTPTQQSTPRPSVTAGPVLTPGPAAPAPSPPIPVATAPASAAPRPSPKPARAASWRIDSTPPGADVFAMDGRLLGRTPYVANLARGERAMFVRMIGYEDELVKYDPNLNPNLNQEGTHIELRRSR